MYEDLNRQLELLQQAMTNLETASKQALGFSRSVQYMGIVFNVGRRFVIADLAPLAFFHLVEPIDDSADAAVVRLYERLGPLLTCRHDWTELKRGDLNDDRVRALSPTAPHVCRHCTAYALSSSLPVVGRTLR